MRSFDPGGARGESTRQASTIDAAPSRFMRASATAGSTSENSPDQARPTNVNGIRRLAMAPRPTGSEGGRGGLGMMQGSGGSGGGGTTPPDLPPFISGGGAGAYGGTTNGVGTIPAPIPVGANVGFYVSSITSGYTIDTTQVSWTGGTDYKTYNSQLATAPPPTSQQLVKGVPTNSGNYSFIVDATPQQYTIKVDVTYTNGAKGSSTLTFTSARPVFTFANSAPGGVIADFIPQHTEPPPREKVLVGIPEPSPAYGDKRVKFTATTGPEPSPTLYGDYMIMQLINFNNHWADGQGIMYYLDTGGYAIDDGLESDTIKSPVSIGQPLGNPPAPTRGWTQSASPVSNSYDNYDNPYIAVGLNETYVSIDAAFKTYLMYKPTGGVWIALAEYDWNFKSSATNATPGPGAYSWSAGQIVNPSPTPSIPSEDDAFPTWTIDLFSTGWV